MTCPMCRRDNCPQYMSDDCTDAVFEQNPDFGIRVLTKIITQGKANNKYTSRRGKKIREFIDGMSLSELQELYNLRDVAYICSLFVEKHNQEITINAMNYHLRTKGIKFRPKGGVRGRNIKFN